MGIAKEFREFAVKGNVIDLAVGVIIGGAFGKIVDSVVSDLIMPVVGLVFGKLDFSNLFIVLGSVPEGTPYTLEAIRKAGVPVLAYGNFITVALVVKYLLIHGIIFRTINPRTTSYRCGGIVGDIAHVPPHFDSVCCVSVVIGEDAHIGCGEVSINT